MIYIFISIIISIHAAREGGDKTGCIRLSRKYIFQSTPPVKAATLYGTIMPSRFLISIHAAREGGDAVNYRNKNLSNISIHAAREGGDVPANSLFLGKRLFQSTPPVKAATYRDPVEQENQRISIHAAREGGDWENP